MKTLLLLHLCLLPFHTPAQDANKWEFKSEKDGCKIYHQHTEGLLHIKLATSFKVPLSGIALLFSEVESYTQWGYKMVESRLLRRVSDTELYYYARYDFPWPISDKDIILHSKLSQNPLTGVLTIVNTPQPDYLPVKKGIERIRNTTTRWQCTKGNGGWIYTEQLISTDSAEGLPDWLVKLTADTGPRETAGNIKKMLSQERFQKASLAHIREH